jgi:hypothetical protein
LYFYCTLGSFRLTLPTCFETVLESIADTGALKPVPILVIGLAAVLCPCEEDFQDHVNVHGYYTKPQDCSLFAVRDPQQSDSESCFGPCLPNQGPTGRDVDQNVHAIIPIAIVVTRRIFASN